MLTWPIDECIVNSIVKRMGTNFYVKTKKLENKNFM